MHLRPFVRQVQVDSLHDLTQKQERNSRRIARAGSPFIHLMDKLQYSSSHPLPTGEGT